MPQWVVTRPVSVESRLNRIYPQMEAQGIVPFIYRIQSSPAGDFFVASGSGVIIRSSFTEKID